MGLIKHLVKSVTILGISATISATIAWGAKEIYKSECLVKPSEIITVKVDKNVSYEDVTEKEKSKVEKIIDQDYKTVIRELKTPLEAIVYCMEFIKPKYDEDIYGEGDYYASFKHIHKNRKDDCDGGALAAAAILSDNGFHPYIAILANKSNYSHAVFIYKTTKGEYGSIGINRSDCVSGFDSIEKLREKIGKWYSIIHIYDLNRYFPDYIDNDKNNDVLPPSRGLFMNLDVLEKEAVKALKGILEDSKDFISKQKELLSEWQKK